MLKQFINAKTPVLQEQAFFGLPIPIVRPTLDDFQIFFSIDAKDDAILLVNMNTPVPRKIPFQRLRLAAVLIAISIDIFQ